MARRERVLRKSACVGRTKGTGVLRVALVSGLLGRWVL